METVLRSANVLRHNLPMSLKSGAAALIAACSVALAQPRIRVTSKDGVPISVIKTGSGSPLVMVHGSSSVALSWARVLPELSKNFTLYVMDRRGRKPSGDSADYSPQSEVDDIAAVIAAVGHPVTLLAHSYGALLSVLAATQGDRLKGVSRLILYEPPVYQQPRAERLQEIRKAEQAGDTDRIATLFLSGFLEEKELNAVRASPAWPALVSIAGTLPREVQSRE